MDEHELALLLLLLLFCSWNSITINSCLLVFLSSFVLRPARLLAH